jgi:hypothetical protein
MFLGNMNEEIFSRFGEFLATTKQDISTWAYSRLKGARALTILARTTGSSIGPRSFQIPWNTQGAEEIFLNVSL